MLVTTVIVALEKGNYYKILNLLADCSESASTRPHDAKTVQILGFRFCIQQMHKRNTPGTVFQCFSSGIAAVGVTAENFGTTLDLLKLSGFSVETSRAWTEIIDCFGGRWMPCRIRCIPNLDPFTLRTQSESFALGRSFELMVQALGGDRDRVGDAIYGALTGALVTMKDQGFKPRLQHTNTKTVLISFSGITATLLETVRSFKKSSAISYTCQYQHCFIWSLFSCRVCQILAKRLLMFLNEDVQVQIGLRPQSQCYLRMSPRYLLRNRMQLNACLKFEEKVFFAQDKFITPRAVLSLALFNGFRVLGTKNVDPEDLRLSVEGMAFKPESQ